MYRFKCSQDCLKWSQKSVKTPQLPSVLFQSPTLGGGQRAFKEDVQELTSFRVFLLHQPQACCSAQNPYRQPFHMHSMHLTFPLTSNHLWTGPHLHASQTPTMPYTDYIHPNTLHLAPMPTVYANNKQWNQQG